MITMTDAMESRRRLATRRRPRLHHVYFLLAAFDLLTVSVSLLVIDHLVDRYVDTVAANTEWAARMGEYAELNRLAIRVNTPGNNVFNNELSVEDAREEFKVAMTEFQREEARARNNLIAMPGIFDVATESELDRMLDNVSTSMAGLQTEATQLFGQFEKGNRTTASAFMARMDQKYAAASLALNAIGQVIREAQGRSLEKQAQAARGLRQLEFFLGLLIICMVAAVTVYGHKLSRQVRRSGDELEDLVAERTADLEATHDRLRMADRLASIGTLAAGLGHDINNILFPMRCHLESLRDTQLDDEARADVDAIQRSTEYLQQLTDAIRMFARDPDAPSVVGVTRLDEWWTTVRTLMLRAVGPNGVLEERIPEDVPPVAIPPHQLTQAVLNLLVNAAEAIDEAGHISVWAERSADESSVRLGVTDDGCGMTEEVRRQVLDPFFTTKARGKSTGLGLSMVHGVVTGAGGSVEIDSTPGRGTTVVLNLPRAEDLVPAREDGEPPIAIISVEDPRRAAFVRALAEAHGYAVRRDDGVATASRGVTWIVDDGPNRLATIRDTMDASSIIVLTEQVRPDVDPGDDLVHYVPATNLGELRTAMSPLLRGVSENVHG